MELFDSHCHFEGQTSEEMGAILHRARLAGVTSLLAVGGNSALNEGAKKAAVWAMEHPDVSPRVSWACGFDWSVAAEDAADGSATEDFDVEMCETQSLPAPSVWGEIGLDYHYSPETRDLQRVHFRRQLEAAARHHLPVSIHTREADEDTLAALREIPSRGIIHCFTGTPSFAEALLEFGFYISFSGIVTFKAAENVRASARVVPLARMLIETDAPFLAPVPHRGERNEPAFVRHTCEFLATLKGVSAEELAAITYRNAEAAIRK